MTYDTYAANGFDAPWLWPLTEPHNHNQATASAVCEGPALREDKNMSNETGTSTHTSRYIRVLVGAALAVAALTASVDSTTIDSPPSKDVVRYSASDPVPTPALVNPQADPPPVKNVVTAS